jgi:hypothetical protein
MIGKTFDGSGVLGPYLVTADQRVNVAPLRPSYRSRLMNDFFPGRR